MAADLTQAYEFLDQLPDMLYVSVVTHRAGDLVQRCLDVLCIRHDLLEGNIPNLNSCHWIDPCRWQSIDNAFRHDDFVSSCKNNENFTDRTILDILQYLNGDKDDFIPSQIKDDNAQNDATDLTIKNQSGQEQKIKSVLKGFSVMRKLGWDLSQGVLRKMEWKHILDVHDTIKQSPRLRHIIQNLGRSQWTEQTVVAGDVHFQSNSDASEYRQQRCYSIRAPVETRGISYSDDIGRMLPFELAKLGHRKLKTLWHARRAEGMLLSYQYEGVLSEHIPVLNQQQIDPESDENHTMFTQGPMILCLDTSASMKGYPEHMAKAITFEMMRVCLNHKRPCMLLAFSGSDEIHEYVLDHSEQGWENILHLVSLSFHGGTDVTAVVERALSFVDKRSWQQADVCMISDSRFAVAESLIEKVNGYRQQYQLRLQGINVSRWKSTEMEKLCHPVYRMMYPFHLADIRHSAT